MSDAIIVLNAGSSSLKFSIHELDVAGALTAAASGQIEGLGTSPRFTVKDGRGEKIVEENIGGATKTFGHRDAFAHIARWSRAHFEGRLTPIAVGHRFAHGGLKFAKPALITPSVLSELEDVIPLMPLHQPHNLAGVRAVSELNPTLPQVACFDTAFHQGRPRVSERFGLPDELFREGVRRWGFHGTSFESIVGTMREVAPDVIAGRVVAAHLGSGVSLCALRDGKSIDTTMSFSALDGMPMETRCGALDPGVVLYLLDRMSRAEIETMLYKKSGLLGISGVSNDMRDLLESKEQRAKEAVDFFVYRVTCQVGAFAAALGGLDALVFTAGIGERSPEIRRRVCDGLDWLGIRIDANANARNERRISPQAAKPSVWVIPTNEEAVIARHTLDVVQAPRLPAARSTAREARPAQPQPS